MKQTNITQLASSLALALVLSACGGGGSSAPAQNDANADAGATQSPDVTNTAGGANNQPAGNGADNTAPTNNNGSSSSPDTNAATPADNGAETSTESGAIEGGMSGGTPQADQPAANYPAWQSSTIYTGGDKVSAGGNNYEAKWWTQGDDPADNHGDGQVWKLIGANTPAPGSPTDADNTDGNTDSNTGETESNTDTQPTDAAHSRPDGQVIGSYFVEWGVYGRNYHVMDMPAEKLTHVLYGFIPVCGPNKSLQEANPSGYSALVSQCQGKQDFEVTVHDKYAALEKSYPGDQWDDPIRGNFGQLIKLKQQYPHLKVLPSVGGWTLSDPFYTLANDANKRAIFVNSVADFLRSYTFFDGVDIDWEFPGGRGANANLGSQADFEGYADLMRELRVMLDGLEVELGKTLELTSAIGASPTMVAAANYQRAHQYMDYIFAMTYDYHGAWSGVLGHHTALNNYTYNTQAGFYASSVLDSLLAHNVPASKIVLGAAMYGRGWTQISGAQPDWPFSGVGQAKAKGSWEAGVLDYKDIVENYLGGSQGSGINGFTYYYDADAEAPYLWNYNTGTLITYDNPQSVKAKAEFVKAHGLAGLFAWEIDADNGDIINAMTDGLSE